MRKYNKFLANVRMENGDKLVSDVVSIVISQASLQEVSVCEYLSYTFGSLYMALWSISFYPQLWENYKRQNSYGLSFEYVFIHPFTYLFYCIYTLVTRVEMSANTSY